MINLVSLAQGHQCERRLCAVMEPSERPSQNLPEAGRLLPGPWQQLPGFLASGPSYPNTPFPKKLEFAFPMPAAQGPSPLKPRVAPFPSSWLMCGPQGTQTLSTHHFRAVSALGGLSQNALLRMLSAQAELCD